MYIKPNVSGAPKRTTIGEHLKMHREYIVLRTALEQISVNWPWVNFITAADIAQRALEDVEDNS